MILVILKHSVIYLKTFVLKKMTMDDAEIKKNEFDVKPNALSRYSPRSQSYIEAKNKILVNAKKLLQGEKNIIEGFKKGIFPLKSDDESKKFNEKESPKKVDVKEFNELIIKKEKGIDKEIFKKYLDFQTQSALLKNLYNLNDKAKNNDLVNVIKS